MNLTTARHFDQRPFEPSHCYECGKLIRQRVTLTAHYFPEREQRSAQFCRRCFGRLRGWIGAERARLRESEAA